MAAELILVNPRRKRRSSPRKMSALQRKYFGKRRSRAKVSRVRRNPRRRRSYAASPVRRRRSYRVSRVRRNPRRIRRYASRTYSSARGVVGGAMGFAKEKLLPGAIGAGGALAVDLAIPYVAPYLPAVLVTGYGMVATRLAAAVAIGYGGRMIGGKRFGDEVMNGAIIVTLYDALKGAAVAAEPALFGQPGTSQTPTQRIASNCQCCGSSYECCGCAPAGQCNGSVGAYVDGLGWTAAARQVGAYVDGY